VDHDFNGGYGCSGGALRVEVCSVGHNVRERENIQTALLSDVLFFKEKLCCKTSFLLHGSVAWQ